MRPVDCMAVSPWARSPFTPPLRLAQLSSLLSSPWLPLSHDDDRPPAFDARPPLDDHGPSADRLHGHPRPRCPRVLATSIVRTCPTQSRPTDSHCHEVQTIQPRVIGNHAMQKIWTKCSASRVTRFRCLPITDYKHSPREAAQAPNRRLRGCEGSELDRLRQQRSAGWVQQRLERVRAFDRADHALQ